MLLEKSVALVAGKRKTAVARRKRIEEGAVLLANSLGAAQNRGRAELEEPQGLIRVPGQLFETVIGNLAPEVIAGHVFDFMGFVEDHGGVFREDAAEIVVLEGQVGEKQMMIDDDEIGFLGALVHGGDKTLVEVIAFLAGADVSAGVEAGPQIGIVGKKSELAAVAGFG